MKNKTLWLAARVAAILWLAAGVSSAQVVVNIVGEDGNPIGDGTQVTLSSQGDSNRSDMSGSNGIARFAGIARGTYSVTVRAPGYQDGYRLVNVPDNGEFSTTVTLKAEPRNDGDAIGMLLAPKARKELDRGIDAMRRQDYKEAEKHLDVADKLAPGNTDVNDKLGELFLVTADLDKAQKYLQIAVSLDPENESVLTDLGELRIEQRDYPAGEKMLERAVMRDPNTWFAHWMLAGAYLRTNDNEKARVEAAAAIKYGRGNANDAECVLGEALARLGRTDEAIRALQLFLRDSPQNSYAPEARALLAKLQTGPAVPASQPATNIPNLQPSKGSIRDR